MATITRLFLQALVTKTAAFGGAGVDVSVVLPTGGSAGSTPSQVATLCIHVASIDANATARLAVFDTIDNFSSDTTPVEVVYVQGSLGSSYDQVFRLPWYDVPDARFGVTSAKMKISLLSINAALAGTLATGISYEAWIEY